MKHEWIHIELMGQLVRTKASGEYPAMMQRAKNAVDPAIMEYIISRTQNVQLEYRQRGWSEKIKEINLSKIHRKIVEIYVLLVKRLLPRSLRAQIIDDTPIGEKHKWMYDRKSLARILEGVGFEKIEFMSATNPGL